MRFLRDLPIRHKLISIILLTSVAAVALACVVFIGYEQFTFRRALVREYAILAELFGDNLAPGLTFNDPDSVAKMLKPLGAHPHVLAAAVFDKAGQRVATYERTGTTGKFPWPPPGEPGSKFQPERLDTFQTITLAGETIGTLYLAADLTELAERRVRYAQLGGLALLLSGLVAYWFAQRLQRVISVPVSDLAETASQVAFEQNYSLRAVKHGPDELGHLVDQFNAMLARIQQQAGALQDANVNLERRVAERTGELQREVGERQLAEANVRKSEAQLNTVIENLSEGLIISTLEGNLLHWNQAALRQFGYASVSEARERLEEFPSVFALTTLAGAAVPFAQWPLPRILRGEKVRGLELGIRRLGTDWERIFSYAGEIVHPASGQPLAFVTVNDITERKRAEAELHSLHQQLVATSRRAGMAEVATSVLHNVGNVLNSVSVSTEVVSGKVRQLRTSGLKSAAQLLQEHAHDLTAFLTEDARGRELPAYLIQLAGQLGEPQQGILQELELLRKNLDHIKEIVAMQQSHARGSGVWEPLSVAELVEDALRINAAGFDRHQVRLVQEFSPVPPLVTDRHQVLQILVNLVSNAKYAVAGMNGDKRLRVRVTPTESAGVKIEVIDNGMGIAPENLDRIFQHGFTTRRDGHGFGLHSGALAAKELGGRLTVQSEGVGRGAVFTLELPPRHPKEGV
ncbi:MAG: hypothetical protein RL514_2419 [Verrucomicrobiota bacterium]|jgi:signal transduction histidine kinase